MQHRVRIITAVALLLAAASSRAGVVQPPLGTDHLRRQAIEHPHALIRQVHKRLDKAGDTLPPKVERGLLWWLGSAALNVNDGATLTESVLRLQSLGQVYKDPVAKAAAGYLRAFQHILTGNGSGLSEALKAASLVQASSDAKVVAWSKYELCDAYTQLGHPRRGLPLCRDAERAARAVGDTWEIADDENDIAWNLTGLHHAARAVPYYKRSRRDFTSIGETQVASMVGDNLAHAYLQLHHPHEALALSRASLVKENASGLHSDALLSYANVARAYDAMGRHADALREIASAIAGAKRTHNNDLLPDFYAAESLFAEHAGHLHQALKSARIEATTLRNQHSPGLLATEAALEKRYAARERELRIRDLERQNTIKDLQLKAARAEADRQNEAERRESLHSLVMRIIALAALLVASLLYLLWRSQRRHAAHMREQALHDPLTGADNRRAFMLAAEQLLDPAGMASRSTHALLLIDVDHFKRINDTAGHPAGDRVLSLVVERMQLSCGAHGRVARLGGEEFAVLCPRMSGPVAERLAERLRQDIAHLSLETVGNVGHVTISIGVAATTDLDQSDIESWLRAADAALYDAKENGRNQVVRATRPVAARQRAAWTDTQ